MDETKIESGKTRRFSSEYRVAKWLDGQREAGLSSLEIAALMIARIAPKTPLEFAEALEADNA